MPKRYASGSMSAKKRVRRPYRKTLSIHRSPTGYSRPSAIQRVRMINSAKPVNNIKYTDINFNTTVDNTGRMVDLLNSVVPGTSSKNQFIGQAIQPISFQIKLVCAATDATNQFRVIIFQYIPPSTLPTMGYVLEAPTYTQSAIDFSHRDDLIILRDFYTHLTPPGTTYALAGNYYGATSNPNMLECYIPGRKMARCQYDSTLNQWSDGKLYVLLLSDSSVVPTPSVEFYARLQYSDII